MAIILTTTDERVTLVHAEDAAVKPRDPTAEGWILLSEADDVGTDATRVEVRALAGHEYLAMVAVEGRGAQALETLRRGVMAVDGQPPDLKVLEHWAVDVVLGLESRILTLSRRPTVARR
jgi:hypothetical protein